MPKVRIRQPAKTDFRIVAEVFAESFVGIENVTEQWLDSISRKFSEEHEKRLCNFKVAEIRGKIVGIGAETPYKGCSYIGYIGVLPKFRKQGIGTKIFEELLILAKKHNRTVELFSNIGADSIYRKFGFQDEFYTHTFELGKPVVNDSDQVQIIQEKPPAWIYQLDKEATGFDRSRLLGHLATKDENTIATVKTNGYAMCNGERIGPLIAKDKHTAHKLISYFITQGANRIIIPEFLEKQLAVFTLQKNHTCLKMTYGEKLPGKKDNIWAYRSFATS